MNRLKRECNRHSKRESKRDRAKERESERGVNVRKTMEYKERKDSIFKSDYSDRLMRLHNLPLV